MTGTPTFFINGVRYQGDYDFESMLAAIQQLPAGIDPQPVRERREH